MIYKMKSMYRLLSVLLLSITLTCSVGHLQAQVPKEDSIKILDKMQLAMDTASTDGPLAWQYFGQALRMAKASGSDYLIGDVLLQEGVLYFQEGNYKEAIDALVQSAPYFEAANSKLKEARCYSNLGYAYQYVGDFAAGLKALFKGLRVAQGVEKNEDLMASLYSNISIAYMTLDDYDNALVYALKSVKFNQALKDTGGLARVYNTIGEIYKYKEAPDKSIENYKKAIAMHRLTGITANEISSISNLANVYLTKDDIDSAIYYKAQTIQYLTENKKHRFSDYCYAITSYGYMLAVSGRMKEAKKYLEDCDACKPLLSDYGFGINYYSFFYQYYKSTGKFELALENLENLKEVNDSLAVESRKFENQRIAIRYEFDTKAKEDSLSYQLKISKQEIATATYKNRMYLLLVALLIICGVGVAIIRRIRKIQNEKRRLALENMRTSIASDLHDDVGSTLSSIQIISSMAMRQCDTNPRLRESVGQISALSDKVSDGIREIVWSVNPAHDKLKSVIDLMRKLANEVLSPNDIGFRFHYKVKDEEKLLTPQQRKDLLMIFKEALNNARKYSGATQVDINIYQEGALLKLQIKDYGSGFDMQQVLRGNGLDNMKRRAAAIQAELAVHSRPGNGTFLCLKMPLP